MRYYTSFNIIHRDLKPYVPSLSSVGRAEVYRARSNILLDNTGSVRIVRLPARSLGNAADA